MLKMPMKNRYEHYFTTDEIIYTIFMINSVLFIHYIKAFLYIWLSFEFLTIIVFIFVSINIVGY